MVNVTTYCKTMKSVKYETDIISVFDPVEIQSDSMLGTAVHVMLTWEYHGRDDSCMEMQKQYGQYNGKIDYTDECVTRLAIGEQRYRSGMFFSHALLDARLVQFLVVRCMEMVKCLSEATECAFGCPDYRVQNDKLYGDIDLLITNNDKSRTVIVDFKVSKKDKSSTYAKQLFTYETMVGESVKAIVNPITGNICVYRR